MSISYKTRRHLALLNRTFTSNSTINRKSDLAKYNYREVVSIKPASCSKALDLHTIWLRHHCGCEKCYNPKTFQKMLIPSHLPEKSIVKDLQTCLKTNSVQITWNDGHKSAFNLDWLTQIRLKLANINTNIVNEERFDYDYKVIAKFPSNPLENAVHYNDFMSCNDYVAQLLENIVKYGYGIVNNAPDNFNTTKKVVFRISHPQHTIYGDFSEWTSNLAHADTAYTSDFVHLHTDTSYFSEPMGLQMFHCLKHDGNGGVNSLVDGFGIAKKFYQEFKLDYSILSQLLVPSQYLDDGHHFYSVDTTFRHDIWTREIERFRYNPHDMATLDTIPFDEVGDFYKCLVKLSDQIEASPTWLKLSPGIIIFLDNWRVLHGRSEFTGFRHLCGAYFGRSDWLSKARVLGVIK